MPTMYNHEIADFFCSFLILLTIVKLEISGYQKTIFQGYRLPWFSSSLQLKRSWR